MSIARAWYVRCDGPCGGNPAEISTESAVTARRYAMRYGYGDGGEATFERRKIGRRTFDLCPGCKVLTDPEILAYREGGWEAYRLVAAKVIWPDGGPHNDKMEEGS